MPINERGRSTKTGQWTTLSAMSSGARPQQKSIKVTRDTSHPSSTTKHAGHHQIAGGSLTRVLGSTNGSCDIYWRPWVVADIEHLGGSVYRQDQEFGIDWVPALKETSLVCHSSPVREGLST